LCYKINLPHPKKIKINLFPPKLPQPQPAATLNNSHTLPQLGATALKFMRDRQAVFFFFFFFFFDEGPRDMIGQNWPK
jgi:hypothetical protein